MIIPEDSQCLLVPLPGRCLTRYNISALILGLGQYQHCDETDSQQRQEKTMGILMVQGFSDNYQKKKAKARKKNMESLLNE